jgi:hypothetical protein
MRLEHLAPVSVQCRVMDVTTRTLRGVDASD